MSKRGKQGMASGDLGVAANGEGEGRTDVPFDATPQGNLEQLSNAVVEKPKKRREAYYLILGMAVDGTPESVLGTFRSQRAAEKWLVQNRVLLSKITQSYVLVRGRNITPRLEMRMRQGI